MATASKRVRAEFPPKLECLFKPARYKVLYGGRGGAKSWGVARALLIEGARRPLRVLCAREFQNSIKDSVHKLLSDQVEALDLSGFYEVQQATIRGQNGTEFSFAGIRHNVANIKSFEGVDIAWVEEAHTVSKASWATLIPTIRKEGSEIWVTFNPELETDETYQRFIKHPPQGAIIEKLNWTDNPWFPEVLRAEKDALKERDPDAYLTIWEGHCRQTLDGAVYAKELRDATAAGRITAVPYDPSKPVHTFWDLGWADATAVWFAQAVGFEYRVIDYVEDNHKTIGHFLKLLQSKGYVYGTDYLPHDGASEQQAAGGRSIQAQMIAAGRTVHIVPKMPPHDGINAARTIFPLCWFDADRCADGLQCLRHYRYERDDETNTWSRKPVHDWASHGADAFRALAVSITNMTKRPLKLAGHSSLVEDRAGAWMG